MRVLISRPDKIGDVILALHAVKQLASERPGYDISMDVSSYTSELVKNIAFVDHVFEFGQPIPADRFDAVVDLMAKFPAAWHYSRSRVPRRIGNNGRLFSALYTQTRGVRRSKAILNEAEYNWQFISMLDETLRHSTLSCSLEPSDFREIEVKTTVKSKTVVLMPGKSVSAESWPIDSWLSLASLMIKQGLSPAFLLGPVESDLKSTFGDFVRENPRAQVFSDLSISEILGLFSVVSGYIGPSTGITHLASVFKLPGVALYPEKRSMARSRWAPFNTSLSVIRSGIQSSPEMVMKQFLGGEINVNTREKVSAFLICKNEELSIERCIRSIDWCDEVLVVDSGSTDKTLDICRQFPRVRIIEKDWPGHRLQKQFALKECRYDWILNLDADEELSADARNKILNILEKGTEVDGFFLCRLVYFLNRWWDKGGWHPEYRMRFFRKQKAVWGGVDPHEKAIVTGRKAKIKGYIYHYSFSDFTELVNTHNVFSSRTAEMMHSRGVRSSATKIILRPLIRFSKFYFLKLGIREGLAGFQVATIEAYGAFLKYAKLWELEKTSHNESIELKSKNQEKF